jgi:hypothetical protein
MEQRETLFTIHATVAISVPQSLCPRIEEAVRGEIGGERDFVIGHLRFERAEG